MTGAAFEKFMASIPSLTQEQKDQRLFMMCDNLPPGPDCPEWEAIRALAKAGARLNNGSQMLSYAIRRTDDMQLANVLLDAGWKADGVQAKDLWFFWGEDKDEAYRTLGRLINAGLGEEERIKAAVSALKKGDYPYINAYILKPGEDILKAINSPAFGKLPVASDRNDTRDVERDDIDGYIAWQHSIDHLYDAHFSAGITPEKLAETVTDKGMTGMMLAVRTGRFGEVVGYYRAHPEKTMDPAELTREDEYAQNVLKLLGHRNQLQSVFAPDLWRERPEAALILLHGTPACYRDQLDEVKIAAEMAENRLAKRKPPAPQS